MLWFEGGILLLSLMDEPVLLLLTVTRVVSKPYWSFMGRRQTRFVFRAMAIQLEIAQTPAQPSEELYCRVAPSPTLALSPGIPYLHTSKT